MRAASGLSDRKKTVLTKSHVLVIGPCRAEEGRVTIAAMRPSRLLTASTLAALATLSSASLAAPSAKDRAEARALVSEAKRAMTGKRWVDAVSALKKARAARSDPAVALDSAAVQVAAGRLWRRERRSPPVATPAAAPARPTQAERRARDAASKALADLDRRVPTVQVKVAGPPAGQVDHARRRRGGRG